MCVMFLKLSNQKTKTLIKMCEGDLTFNLQHSLRSFAKNLKTSVEKFERILRDFNTI